MVKLNQSGYILTAVLLTVETAIKIEKYKSIEAKRGRGNKKTLVEKIPQGFVENIAQEIPDKL